MSKQIICLYTEKILTNLKIAIVGDCHGQWSDADIRILSLIKPDVVLFVGDISDGSIKIIKKINLLRDIVNPEQYNFYCKSEIQSKRKGFDI